MFIRSLLDWGWTEDYVSVTSAIELELNSEGLPPGICTESEEL